MKLQITDERKKCLMYGCDNQPSIMPEFEGFCERCFEEVEAIRRMKQEPKKKPFAFLKRFRILILS
jgi:hypothetical protein